MSSIFNCWKWILNLKDDLLHRSPSSSSSSSSSSLELSDDVVTDILLRLPPPVLPRILSLDERSFNLITSPLFQTTYRPEVLHKPHFSAGVFYQHVASNSIGFASAINDNDEEEANKRGFKNIDKSLSFLPHPVQILASSQGLILCTKREENQILYIVCNPVTKQYILLPILESEHESDYSIGFFVDNKFGKYHVVKIRKQAPKNTIALVHTFSSESRAWKKSQIMVKFPYCLFNRNRAGVQWNDSLYWVDGLDSILVYDIKKQTFGLLALPNLCAAHGYGFKRDLIKKGILSESDGKLFYGSIHLHTLRLWVLVDGVWKIQQVANLKIAAAAILRGPQPEILFKLVGVDGFSPHVMYLMFCDKLISYHLKTRKVENLNCSKKVEIDIAVFPYILPELPYVVE